jgi:glycosyltransferase involved in cell wall biosynthesis
MKVLLVAHHFPPDGGAGSQRPASFAQHLPTLGVDLTVVCRGNVDDAGGRTDPKDPTLTGRTASARIRRAARRGNESWIAALLRETLAAADAERPDVLLLTLSPFEHAAIGPVLRERFGTPYALDLRDPWALDGWLVFRHWLDWRRARNSMRNALEDADGVILNVPGARPPIEALAPRRGKLPYCVVTNGWEESDFPTLAPVQPGDAMRIRFAGTFVCRFLRYRTPVGRLRRALLGRGERIDERGRSPLFLLEAIRRLRESDRPSGRAIRLEVAGTPEADVDRIVAESGCADAFAHRGYLSHDQSTRFIAGADVLLLPMHGLPAGARARMVPGKFYEYLATGRPILGLCPAGDARDWLGEDARSRLAPPTDPDAIAEALDALYREWRTGGLSESLRAPLADRFTRARQAAALASYLEDVAALR